MIYPETDWIKAVDLTRFAGTDRDARNFSLTRFRYASLTML